MDNSREQEYTAETLMEGSTCEILVYWMVMERAPVFCIVIP